MANPEFTKIQKGILAEIHKKTSRHSLVIETDLKPDDVDKIYKMSSKVRNVYNDLVRKMNNRLYQMGRTKAYRRAIKKYRKAKEEHEPAKAKEQQAILNALKKKYDVTFDFLWRAATPICQHYGVLAIFGRTCAENIWTGSEKILYGEGKKLHFKRGSELPSLRAKEYFRGIILKNIDGKLHVSVGNLVFGVKIKDRFHEDEVNGILEFLKDPYAFNCRVLDAYLNNNQELIETHRPCYAILKCKTIRNRRRVFLDITIEGKPCPKYRKDGTPRHKLGTGRVACDIGTQTIAYTTDNHVGLENLAERGSSIKRNESVERKLLRAMDRSRRATNSQWYKKDGTPVPGRHKWVYSNHFRKLLRKYRDISRINAENRHYAINEQVNNLRSLGNVLITEAKNTKSLSRRAIETTVNSSGRFNRKKRFGRSVRNRCAGYFQAQVEAKFVRTGGTYHEVPQSYRASQYDHTADDYKKKRLSTRMFELHDGTQVQRDWYSSFLMYCATDEVDGIDIEKCYKFFKDKYRQYTTMVDLIVAMQVKVYNSGIKIKKKQRPS